MYEAVEDIKKNNKVRSVILCSLAPGIFCAGKMFFFIALDGSVTVGSDVWKVFSFKFVSHRTSFIYL